MGKGPYILSVQVSLGASGVPQGVRQHADSFTALALVWVFFAFLPPPILDCITAGQQTSQAQRVWKLTTGRMYRCWSLPVTQRLSSLILERLARVGLGGTVF